MVLDPRWRASQARGNQPGAMPQTGGNGHPGAGRAVSRKPADTMATGPVPPGGTRYTRTVNGSPAAPSRYPGPRHSQGGPRLRASSVRPPEQRGRPRRAAVISLLAAILLVQAALSLRLVWANTAFQDEALYLWAGHLELASWLHGLPIPPLPSYFPGAPVLYPPLAALADHLGGLAGARILSLCLMLGASLLLWDSARLLVGMRAAFFATAIFAVLGPTLALGAFASNVTLSLFLTALAAWCVIRAGSREDVTIWMIGAGTALAIANAATYSSVLFDPVVIALAVMMAYPKPGGKTAAGHGAILLTIIATVLMLGTLIGGGDYVTGAGQALFSQLSIGNAAGSPLTNFWSWLGILTLAAMCGVLASLQRRSHALTWLLALLALAVLLVPVKQSILHATISLEANAGTGAWFAAIPAGYAIDRFIGAAAPGRMRVAVCGACAVALAFPLSLGAGQSWALSRSWANSSSFIAIFRPLADHGSGRLLVEDPSVAEYYLPAGRQWWRWSGTRTIVVRDGNQVTFHTGSAELFDQYIAEGYFSYVALNFGDTITLDHAIRAALGRNRSYQIVQVIPYGVGTYVIWRYRPRQARQPGGYQPFPHPPARVHHRGQR